MKKRFLTYILLLTILPLFAEKFHQIEIYESDKEVVQKLRYIGVEFDHFRFDDTTLKLVVSDSDLDKMDQNNIFYSITIEDLTAYYQSRFTSSESRDFPDGSMGGYYTLDEIINKIDELHDNFSDIVSEKFSIGTTIEGRNIWAR